MTDTSEASESQAREQQQQRANASKVLEAPPVSRVGEYSSAKNTSRIGYQYTKANILVKYCYILSYYHTIPYTELRTAG
eukprot:6126675-Pleurochrysis_carterae.AAC.1